MVASGQSSTVYSEQRNVSTVHSNRYIAETHGDSIFFGEHNYSIEGSAIYGFFLARKGTYGGADHNLP
jgi:hypothetical protein